jgi:hypothetical protein
VFYNLSKFKGFERKFEQRISFFFYSLFHIIRRDRIELCYPQMFRTDSFDSFEVTSPHMKISGRPSTITRILISIPNDILGLDLSIAPNDVDLSRHTIKTKI